MKGFEDQENSENNIRENSNIDNSKKQIINQAIQFHLKGNIPEAVKHYQHIINQGWNDNRVFLNYGVILKTHGKLNEAEFFIRKAIEINPDYALGAITTLWSLRDECQSGQPIVMMDGDVLYDQRLLTQLVDGERENCLLFDSNIEPGEEPVKICLSGGEIVDFGKAPTIAHDSFGEWVGFTRFSAEQAARIPGYVAPYIERGETDRIYEVAIREQLVDADAGVFGIVDITGMPWIEIDFQEDVDEAAANILPRLEPLPR